jgi:hypothetical protein
VPTCHPRVQVTLDPEIQARAQAIEELLAYDFSRLSDIVAKRESDRSDKLALSSKALDVRYRAGVAPGTI